MSDSRQLAIDMIADVADDIERIAHYLQTTNVLRSRELASKADLLHEALRLIAVPKPQEAR